MLNRERLTLAQLHATWTRIVIDEIGAGLQGNRNCLGSFYEFILLLLCDKSPDSSEIAEYLGLFPWYSLHEVEQSSRLDD